MGNIWSQSVARRSLLGAERTHNPSPAASSILGRRVGARRVAGLVRRALRRRRSYHRGNPLPAALAVLGGIGGLGKRFRARSDKRAAALAPALVIAANSGNLTVARGLIERSAVPMNAAEKAVWLAAAGQLSPRIRGAVSKYAELIPAADQSSPEAFAASAQATPVSLGELEQQEREELASRRAEARAGSAAQAAAAERREARLTELGAAGLQALARGGRRPRRRRSRRSSRGRTFRF